MESYKNSIPRFELTSVQTNFPKQQISNASEAADFIRQFYGDDIHIFESAFILLLNNNSQTIGFAKVAQGGITSTVIDIRLVAHYAINALATSVIIAHNHPSGNNSPSKADIELTKKFKQGLSILEVTLLDSLIITGTSYYSLATNGDF